MTKAYIIGVDGGNTKTHYALFDLDGNLVSFIKAGTASHERMINGYDGMKEELERQLLALIQGHDLQLADIKYSILGLAGADIKKQYVEIGRKIDEIGLRNYKVYNDAFLGIKAGCPKGYGINCVNGTGTSCVGIDRTGSWVQVGGCGEITGDFVGGGFIETAVIRIVYVSIFKCGAQTMMKDMLFDVLGLENEELFIDAVYDKIHGRTISNEVIPKIVFTAANKGDKEALRLLRQVGREAAKSVAGTFRRLDYSKESEVDIVMSGSIFVKGENQTIVETFKSEVANSILCKADFHLLQEPPVAGAVIWAWEELTGRIDSNIKMKVLDNLRGY